MEEVQIWMANVEDKPPRGVKPPRLPEVTKAIITEEIIIAPLSITRGLTYGRGAVEDGEVRCWSSKGFLPALQPEAVIIALSILPLYTSCEALQRPSTTHSQHASLLRLCARAPGAHRCHTQWSRPLQSRDDGYFLQICHGTVRKPDVRLLREPGAPKAVSGLREYFFSRSLCSTRRRDFYCFMMIIISHNVSYYLRALAL
jgi:hypothetical protein